MTVPPLRLLLITARADVGGGPYHVDLLVNHLPADIERWVACPDDAPYAARWAATATVRGVIDIPRRRFSVVALFALSRACRRLGIDVVHSHGKGAGLYARLLKLLNPRIRVVHTFHGVHTGQYGLVTRAAYLAVERVLRRLTTVFVNVSQGEQAQCLSVGMSTRDRSHVVHNGLPLAPAPAPAPELQNEKRPIIVTLARFEHQKNMALAFDVAELAQRTHPDWLFVWAGDGPQRAALEQRARALAQRTASPSNIRFLGVTDHPAQLLAAATVFLSTSRWEGLPYALLEASSLGVPVVATQVVGNDEVVVPGRNGFLFPADRPDQAVAAIGQIVADAALRERLSQGGRAVVAERFSLARGIQQLVGLYRAV